MSITVVGVFLVDGHTSRMSAKLMEEFRREKHQGASTFHLMQVMFSSLWTLQFLVLSKLQSPKETLAYADILSQKEDLW